MPDFIFKNVVLLRYYLIHEKYYKYFQISPHVDRNCIAVLEVEQILSPGEILRDTNLRLCSRITKKIGSVKLLRKNKTSLIPFFVYFLTHFFN